MKYIKTFESLNGVTFKKWLSNNPQDINTTEINVGYQNLIDLNGIENFKNLKILYCTYNKLTELPDLSNLNNLKFLDCYDNKLPYNNLSEYLEWHKKNFPWIWDAKKYNLF